MSINKYKYIIWDWNGTLFNDVQLCVDIMNELLTKRNLPNLSIEKYRQLFDFPVKNYYKKLGFDFEKESFEKLGIEFIYQYNKRRLKCRLYDDVRKTIQFLQSRGLKQFILSAREHNELLVDLKYFGINEFIEDVSGLDNHFANGKVDLGKKMMQKHNISNKECLLIGDTLHDADVASELAVDCILISSGHYSFERVASAGFPFVQSFDALLDFL